MLILEILFFVSGFFVFFAMIGYPISLKFLDKKVKKKKIKNSNKYEPTVTLMIVAHNEENVILKKLDTSLKLDYPSEKIEIIIASDNSTDKTNQIVELFIESHPSRNIKLFKVKERKGKTNAQNEAQKIVSSEILVMTDANSILDINSIKEIVKDFYDDTIVYVTGKLEYVNSNLNSTSSSENSYWNIDLEMRKIESDIQTITAGNGALYAVRNKDYFDIPLIHCHDSYFPQYFALKSKRCVFNEKAIAYEKAGENNEDEYKRKVRMNRTILEDSFFHWNYLNFLKYRWFSYFYFGHRKCRYLLWLNHLIIFVTNGLLLKENIFYSLFFIFQCLFYFLGIIGLFYKKNRMLNIIHYYTLTVVAQIHGMYNCFTGKAKPFWEKAESTR